MANAGKMTTITIIGAGSGGFGLMTHLGSAGYRIRLHDLDDQKLEAIRARGGVDVENGAQPLSLAFCRYLLSMPRRRPMFYGQTN